MRTLAHIGIPTKTMPEGAVLLPDIKVYVTDADKSANKIEWLHFLEGSPLPEILQTSTHLAYYVDDLEKEMAGKTVLIPPFSPMPGVNAAFVMEENLPIEFMQKL